MMFVHSTSPGSQTAASELYKAGPLVATCALCSEASPVTEQEAVEIFSYPCHHPYICPLCRSLFEAAEAADSQVAAETASKQEHNRKTDMNETEEIIDERHDQKREPDEASDNEHENAAASSKVLARTEAQKMAAMAAFRQKQLSRC